MQWVDEPILSTSPDQINPFYPHFIALPYDWAKHISRWPKYWPWRTHYWALMHYEKTIKQLNRLQGIKNNINCTTIEWLVFWEQFWYNYLRSWSGIKSFEYHEMPPILIVRNVLSHTCKLDGYHFQYLLECFLLFTWERKNDKSAQTWKWKCPPCLQ